MLFNDASLLLAVLCACAALADVTPLAGKARLLHNLLRKPHHHHKRGVLHGIPTYKLGYDIPVVRHSVIKPLLVTYPTRPVPIGVKIPLKNPYEVKYPVPVGHAVPVPHPHFGLKFPGWHKPVIVPATVLKEQSGHHDHHIHHHHVAIKPVVPVTHVVPAPTVPLPTPVFPAPAPAAPVPLPAPLPAPVPVLPTPASSVVYPSVHSLPEIHGHALFAPHSVAVRPAFVQPPVVPVLPQPHLYQIRPGNAVQTSLFATYPRYSLYPPQVLASNPHLHLIPQPQLIPHAHPAPVPVQPIPTATGFLPGIAQPGHPEIFIQQPPHQDVWNPVAPPVAIPTAITDQGAAQITPAHGYPVPTQPQHFTDGPQVYENNQENYQHLDQEHSHQEHLHQEHLHHEHLHQIHEQQLYEQHLQQQAEHDHYHQQQLEHQQFHQQQQNEHHYQHLDEHAQQEYGAPQEQYGVPQQHLNLEYGAPPHQQERYDESDGRDTQDNVGEQNADQAYHNHIPLGLQLPLQKRVEKWD